MTVAGMCVIPEGTIDFIGGLKIAPGGTLIATSARASVRVSGGIHVEAGGSLMFGCAPSLTELCGPDTSYVVNGSVDAHGALAVILHGNRINGSVSIVGGGGGATCAPVFLGGSAPAWTTLEGNEVTGGLSVLGLETCWFGIARNHFGESVSIVGSVGPGPDADSNDILANTIDGSLACSQDSPLPHNDGMTNVVGGGEFGQCAGL